MTTAPVPAGYRAPVACADCKDEKRPPVFTGESFTDATNTRRQATFECVKDAKTKKGCGLVHVVIQDVAAKAKKGGAK